MRVKSQRGEKRAPLTVAHTNEPGVRGLYFHLSIGGQGLKINNLRPSVDSALAILLCTASLHTTVYKRSTIPRQGEGRRCYNIR